MAENTEGTRPRRTMMGALDVLVAVLLLLAVWVALPSRWMPIDAPVTLLAMGFAVSGLGLLTGQAWGEKVAKGVATLALIGGVLLVGALGYTVGSLWGLYGPVGMGGATILAIVAALLLPYLVVFPAAQLYFLLPARTAAAAAADPDPDPDPDPDQETDPDPDPGPTKEEE